jgi:hypothetical protein
MSGPPPERPLKPLCAAADGERSFARRFDADVGGHLYLDDLAVDQRENIFYEGSDSLTTARAAQARPRPDRRLRGPPLALSHMPHAKALGYWSAPNATRFLLERPGHASLRSDDPA